MSTDRSLTTLIRSLQTPSLDHDASGLLPSATTLLARLTNPLNVTLLASQLLCAPSLWDRPNDLQSCRRLLSVFNTAAISILHQDGAHDPRSPYPYASPLARDAWLKAVVKGADEKSPRWRHMLLIGGLLIGFEGGNRQGVPLHLRAKLESALVKATNFALTGAEKDDRLGGYSVALVLNHAFELLSDVERSRIHYNLLLPMLMETTFQSPEGLENGYFLGPIDRDVVQVSGSSTFTWSPKSNAAVQIRTMSSKPLMSALGPLSRLISHAIENVTEPRLVCAATDHLAAFARTLLVQWRQNKLSEIDASEEAVFLDSETLNSTLPVLWRLLRTCLFSSIIILRSVLARTLDDPILSRPSNAPIIAMQALQTLRSLSFISSRQSYQSSSQYMFVNLTAIDIISQHPDSATDFLHSIRPSTPGQIPPHPLDRILDHFFLNTAEHFALILSPKDNEDLLISSSIPYLSLDDHASAQSPLPQPSLLPIFEAAHSVILSVLCAPQSANVLAQTHLPFYITALFKAFPSSLSPRQYRLAFKTIIRIASLPTSPLALSQPHLPSTLLELVHERVQHASTTPLPSPSSSQSPPSLEPPPRLSEQAAMVLTLIDALSYLPLRDLEMWLPITAMAMNRIDDHEMHRQCVARFWECLSSGEMDVERANYCVGWWGTGGGREMVLFGREDSVAGVEDAIEDGNENRKAMMSGALNENGDGIGSKL